ncbi:hypothetical protein MRX96_034487 [Rhipicephalus microplus]
MQRVRVTSAIPVIFDSADVDCVSGGLPPSGPSVSTGLFRCCGVDPTVMQASSSFQLEPSMFQAEPVGLSVTFTPEFVAARFEQPPGIQAMTSSGVNAADGPAGVAWNIQGLCETEDGACITVGSAPQQRKSPVETERPLGRRGSRDTINYGTVEHHWNGASVTYALHHVSCTKKWKPTKRGQHIRVCRRLESERHLRLSHPLSRNLYGVLKFE